MVFPHFRAGGALTDRHSALYIKRHSDHRAVTHVKEMDYLLLIEPRQQGKTSLINYLIRHPALNAVKFVYIDVTTLDPSSEGEWYRTLCLRILRQLHHSLPRNSWPPIPTNSSGWRDFLSDIAVSADGAKQYIVIALDEIGAVAFSDSASFFSVLRDVYNSRQAEEEFKRLTFLLAGAFHPRDLISDDKISPFNIAQRVRLPDFDLSQIQQLTGYLNLTRKLTITVAERIYYWTAGQPYLTQLICKYLEPHSPKILPFHVDRAVQSLYHDDENNLPPILSRLRADPKLSRYVRQIYSGHRILYIPRQNHRQGQLELLGIIKADVDGYCSIRNRIYKRALAEIEVLSHDQLQMAQQKGGQIKVMLPPEIKIKGALFLFDIGRWAASELKERWRLARQKKGTEEFAEVDLSKSREKVGQDSETFIQNIATECGTAEVERVLKLIERKHSLISEWKENKVDNEEEYNRQMITRATLRLRQEELNTKIAQEMTEIEADLKVLGVQVTKEQAD